MSRVCCLHPLISRLMVVSTSLRNLYSFLLPEAASAGSLIGEMSVRSRTCSLRTAFSFFAPFLRCLPWAESLPVALLRPDPFGVLDALLWVSIPAGAAFYISTHLFFCLFINVKII